MDPLFLQCETHGFFSRGMARAHGVDDKSVTRLVRSGAWRRFRRGYYCFSDLWDGYDQLQRHRARSRAILHSLGNDVALSHVSGLVAHGVDVWGLPLDRVHVTRLDAGAGRIERDLVHHEANLGPDDVEIVDGVQVLRADLCAIAAAATSTNEVALCVFNSLLHRGHCDHDGLMTTFSAMQHWRLTRHLHIPIRMTDARYTTVGESRGQWLCWAFGLPAPEPQFQVVDADGIILGTCDWGWPNHGVLGEFDGRLKYGRLLAPEQDVGDVVFAEKQREDLLRELTGFSMVRVIWTDYDRPKLTAQRIERALRRDR